MWVNGLEGEVSGAKGGGGCVDLVKFVPLVFYLLKLFQINSNKGKKKFHLAQKNTFKKSPGSSG